MKNIDYPKELRKMYVGNYNMVIIHDANISFVFGVGGEDKKNSSSWILKGWQG
jgi:hypothetical protein